MNTTFIPVTTKQVDFIANLCKQRDTSMVEQHVIAARGKVMTGTLSKKDASDLITLLMAQPRLEGAKAVTGQRKDEPADGIYIIRGEGAFYSEAQIFKVYKMVHGSGRQGVKRLEIVDGENGKNKGKFVYMGLAVKHLPVEAEKMGLEEAKTFGTLYGFCVKCGATLTDDDSIAAGIGPICAGKGW